MKLYFGFFVGAEGIGYGWTEDSYDNQIDALIAMHNQGNAEPYVRQSNWKNNARRLNMADNEQTMCRICQYHQKTKEMPPDTPADRRPCWQLAQRPHAYPPDARQPLATIFVTCSHFSHINGGSITYGSKRR